MGTERDFLAKQFRKDQAIDVIVDLGANGLAAAGITCKLGKNGAALAALTPTTQFTLTGLGDNQYRLRILAATNDTAGLATIYAQNGATETVILSLNVEDGAKTVGDLYSDLSSAALKVQLQQTSIDLITSDILEDDVTARTTANSVGNKIRLLKDTWNDPTAAANATAVWDEDISGVVGANKAGNIVFNMVASVWSYVAGAGRTLTSLGASSLSAIWNYALGSVTAGIGLQLKTNCDAPISTTDAVCDAIKVQTDKMNFTGANIDSDPQTQLTISAASVTAIVTGILAGAVSTSPTAGTIEEALQFARAQCLGKWELDNITASSYDLLLYDTDNTTLLGTFTVTLDANSKPTKRTT